MTLRFAVAAAAIVVTLTPALAAAQCGSRPEVSWERVCAGASCQLVIRTKDVGLVCNAPPPIDPPPADLPALIASVRTQCERDFVHESCRTLRAGCAEAALAPDVARLCDEAGLGPAETARKLVTRLQTTRCQQVDDSDGQCIAYRAECREAKLSCRALELAACEQVNVGTPSCPRALLCTPALFADACARMTHEQAFEASTVFSYGRAELPAKVDGRSGLWTLRTRVLRGGGEGFDTLSIFDLALGVSFQGGFEYGLDALYGAGFRWGTAVELGVAAGLGTGGLAWDHVPIGLQVPVEGFLGLGVGPLRLLTWVRPQWVLGPARRDGGALTSTLFDEMEYGLTVTGGERNLEGRYLRMKGTAFTFMLREQQGNRWWIFGLGFGFLDMTN